MEDGTKKENENIVNALFERKMFTKKNITIGCILEIIYLSFFICCSFWVFPTQYIYRIILCSAIILLGNYQEIQYLSGKYVYDDKIYKKLINYYTLLGPIIMILLCCYDYIKLKINLNGILIYIISIIIMLVFYKYAYIEALLSEKDWDKDPTILKHKEEIKNLLK